MADPGDTKTTYQRIKDDVAIWLGASAALVAVIGFLAKPDGWPIMVALFFLATVALAVYAFYVQKKRHGIELATTAHRSRLEGAEAARLAIDEAHSMRPLEETLRVEPYIDAESRNGLTFSEGECSNDSRVSIRIGLRLRNLGRESVQPTEIEDVTLSPDWFGYEYRAVVDARIVRVLGVKAGDAQHIFDVDIPSAQAIPLPSNGSNIGSIMVRGVLWFAGNRKGDPSRKMLFEETVVVPIRLRRFADASPHRQVRIAETAGTGRERDAVDAESESEAEADAGEGGKRARESGK